MALRTSPTASDFETAAFDLEAAADALVLYAERLLGLSILMDAKGDSFSEDFLLSESFPVEFRITNDEIFAVHHAGERAFFRYLSVYPNLEDEWTRATARQLRMTFVKGLHEVFVEKISVLRKCAAIARKKAGLPELLAEPKISHIYFGEVHMGDVFQGISNSTIVSRSKVEGAFNKLQNGGQGEAANLIIDIGQRVSDSNNPAAGAVYAQIAEEVAKPTLDKGILKSCWDGLVAILPPLANLTAAVVKAFGI